MKKKNYIDRCAYYIMTAPGAILIFLFGYLPMFGIILAFKDFKPARGFFGSPWCGLDNFKAFFSSPDIGYLTRNTVLYNLAFIILGTVIAVVFAILMNELRSKTKVKFYQTIAMMPHFLSWVIVAYLVYAFLGNTYGIVNRSVLPALGIEPIKWYSEPKYWPYILFFVRTWKTVGYSSVIYFAAIAGINPEYYEAAIVDGANRFQLAVKVTLPLLRSIICIQLIMAMGGIFNSDLGLFYNVPMNQGALYPTTNVLTTYIYRNVTKIGYSTAAGLYSSVIGFLMVLLTNFFIRRYDPDSSLF
ncbi:MAG: ABC transporter permease subunit [Clostridiales bacterium]|nr:ABC transporter permease subunit [Clostridiales bacterium]